MVVNGNAVVAGRESDKIADAVISPTITIRKKNYKVVKIGDSAFYDNYYLESVTIPDSITAIGECAFKNCISLTSIFIPDSVKIIGKEAFSDCDSLNIYCEANIIPSNSYQWSDSDQPIYCGIKENNYLEQGGLIYLVKDGNVVVIPGHDKNITDITFSSTVTINGAQYNVTSIEWSAFSEFYRLKNVYFDGTIEDWCKLDFKDPESNPMYKASHFYLLNGNNEYEEVTEIVIPNTILSIGNYQFYGFDNVTKITIPNSVTSIGKSAFRSCSSLTSIKIPNSVEYIEDYTFSNCNLLTSIVIPSSMISIGEWSFSECSSLTDVYFNGTIEDWCKIRFEFSSSNPMGIASNFYILKENNEYEEVTEIIIPNTVTSIGDYQFCSFDKVTNIVIPSSVTYMGCCAFIYCNSATIYCEINSKPSGWYYDWNYSERPVYWAEDWSYVDGVPTPN